MRKTAQQAGITKENILDASLKIFNKKGYSQTTLEDIVSELGLTRGAFYWHFKDKDDLLKQLIFREHSSIARIVADTLVDNPDEKEKLKLLLLKWIDAFYDSQRYRDYVYFVRFAVEFNAASSYYKNLTGLNDFIINEIEKILDAAEKKGNLTIPGSRSHAIHIVSLLDGMFRLYFALPDHLSQKLSAQTIIKNYIEILFKNNEN